ncbi:hypothetical protein PR048_023325 [Dryococelus australis]|uniref:Uncharacterized protein n=1 Tax=Dryococelus australis TaxID=614101 RepID=A0ABQ9GTT0_9NEOP|nr:hypothetical protein PR048_023325 [Dryococelus australis]
MELILIRAKTSTLKANRAIKDIKFRDTGNDEISFKLICLILPVILPTLTDIFDFSIPSRIFPACWKNSFESKWPMRL